MPEEIPQYPFANPSALEPPPEWADLRENRPVAPVRFPSGDEARVLTRYDDVREVLSDPRFTRQLTAPDAARVTANEDGGVFADDLASSIPEGDMHRQWRTLVGRAFTAKRVTQARPRITEMADRLVDDMVAGGAPADLVAAFGFPLPVWVICDILGVPDSDRDRFSYWSDAMLSMTKFTQEEMNASQEEFHAYLREHIAAKRADPGDDLLSELIRITDTGDTALDELVLLGTSQGLLVAGHETTANMIAKMVAMLLSDRTRWQRLLDDRSLIRSAAEEALRFDANPGFGMPRYLTEEIELHGEQLPKGTTVVCSLAAANRDERTFTDAATMDLARTPNPHLSFGAGAHSCLGQALARTELQVSLEVLLRRLPSLDLAVPAGELRRREGLVVGGLEELPVRW